MLDAVIDGFRECNYRVAWRLAPSELRKVGELRADVFCRELGWTGTREDRVERDEFDGGSVHIAVLDEQSEVVGSVRLIESTAPWMLDTVFSALAPAGRITRGADAAEASRLAVHRRWRGKRLGNGMRACDLLYKAAYVYCRITGIRYLYMVVSDIVLEHMQRSGLPCRALGAPREMPDGVRAATVVLDWSRIRENPALAAWYESGWQIATEPPVELIGLHSVASDRGQCRTASGNRGERLGLRHRPGAREGLGLNRLHQSMTNKEIAI